MSAGTVRRPPFRETPVSSAVGEGWKRLFGDSGTLGFSFKFHAFQTAEEFDWAPSFLPGSLGICLNLEGRGTLADARKMVELPPRSSAFYVQGEPALVARRRAGEPHRFVTVEFALDFLRQYLKQEAPHLHPSVQTFLDSATPASEVAVPEPMGVGLLQLVESLQRCPVFKPAQEMWFRCKALELAAQTLFCPPEGGFFCTRQQRVACERAARVRTVLAERLADPPTLEELGRLVGCSPFHLSRQFSAVTGLTIQQYLRQTRLERAADLLRGGRHNVTEAALAVGYNSLSHFTVAFRDAFGCCPGLYPIRTVATGVAADGPGGPSSRVRERE